MDFSRNSQGNATTSSGGNSNAAPNNNNNNMNPFANMNAMNDQELFLRLQASRGGGGFPMDGMFGGGGMGGNAGPGDLNQFMYARRLRALQLQQQQQQQQQQQGSGEGGAGSGPSGQGNADDMLRLRQAGNATAATAAAMFSSGGSSDNNDFSMAQQQQQQHQQFQQFQQQVGYGFGGPAGMFPQSMNMNLPAGAGPAFMMQAAADPTFGGGRGFDDYILRTQQHHAQEAIRAGNADQQRLSPSRFLALQQQQNQQGLSGFGAMGMMDPLGGMGAMGMRSGKDGKLEHMVQAEKASMMQAEKAANKKRYHKKKPSDMPRRPLSAYNLFFSEERERILKEIEAKEKGEELPEADDKKKSKDDKDKPKALLRPLLPSEKKRRPHRKTHGKISFRELAQMVGQRWKALPDDKRSYYQDLAKEDMVRQKKAMEEYYLKQSEKAKGTEDRADEDNGAEDTIPQEIAAKSEE